MNDKSPEKTKQILTTPLPQELAASLKLVLKNLKQLKVDIETKQSIIAEKSSGLIDGYTQLSTNKSIKMNTDIKETFEKSAQHFKSLSTVLTSEIGHYISFYERHLSDNNTSKEITVGIGDSNSFEDYIKNAIKLMKIYLKNRSKEVSVIFSRYDHGLTAQQRKLTILEHMFNKMQSVSQEKQSVSHQ